MTIAIIEDNPDLRAELTALIDGFEGHHCVASFATAEDALPRLLSLNPDVILMDINLPGMSGIECARTLRARLPRASVVMLTDYEDDKSIFESLKAGAVGYLLKKTPPARIFEAIQEVRGGGRIQAERWKLRFATGYDPDQVEIPRRFSEVVTWRGPIDVPYLSDLKTENTRRIRAFALADPRRRENQSAPKG